MFPEPARVALRAVDPTVKARDRSHLRIAALWVEVRAIARMKLDDGLRHRRFSCLTPALGVIWMVAPGTAAAAVDPVGEDAGAVAEGGEEDGSAEHGGEEEHSHYGNAFVLKVAHVETRTLVPAPEEAPEGGGEEAEAVGSSPVERHSALGIAFERVLVDGWLSAELGTLLSSAPGGQVIFPSTGLLKLLWELSEEVEGYLGAGAALELEREKQWAPHWGVAAAAGVYVWIAPETGFNFDLEHSLLLSEGVIADLSLGAGVVTRF